MKTQNLLISIFMFMLCLHANSQIKIETNGDVGIGTDPDQKLHVNGRARIGSNSNVELYSNGSRLLIRSENTDNIAQFSSYGLYLPRTGQNYNLYLAGGLKLGHLEHATLNLRDLVNITSNGTSFFKGGNVYFTNGNVGIGTTPGASRLRVNGDIRLIGDISFSNNLFFYASGANTLQLEDVEYSYNHAIIGYDNNGQTGIYTSSNGEGSIGKPNKQWSEIHAYEYYSSSSPITSDKRLKKNIHNFSGALNMVNAMEPRQYDRKVDDRVQEIDNTLAKLKAKSDEPEAVDSMPQNDSIKIARAQAKEKAIEALKNKKEELVKFSKNQYGFIAQELQKVVPEAVIYKKDIDRYYVDYNMVIPILAAAIQEQNVLVENLQQEVDDLKKENSNSPKLKSANGNENNLEQQTTNALYQNTPNPFNRQTQIKYYLTETTQEAYLNVYDMRGTQLNSVEIHQTGHGSISISANEYTPGLYLYTLIANGHVVGTKQMVLTD